MPIESKEGSSEKETSEERFILAKGLNDILIALGIGLLFLGLMIQIIMTLEQSAQKVPGASPITIWPSMIYALIGLGLSWGLSEYLTGYRKLVLPSIVLTVGLTAFVYVVIGLILMKGDPLDYLFLPKVQDHRFKKMAFLLSPVMMLLVYYWRFRFPFTLFMIGITGTSVALFVASLLFQWGDMGHKAMITSGVFLVSGCLMFFWAMKFDLKDPDRKTRFSDCAFWLHLLAAPLIVGSLKGLFIPDLYLLSSHQAVGLFVLFFILAGVSLIIDRRSFLLSGLFYFGFSISYGAKALMGHKDLDGSVFSITVILLGGLVIFLGIAWAPVRRILITYCVPRSLAVRLRPV